MLDRKLSFWLPFRAIQNQSVILRKGTSGNKAYYLKELKFDFASKTYNKEQLEEELINKINKIELRKIENEIDHLEREFTDSAVIEENEEYKESNDAILRSHMPLNSRRKPVEIGE